MAGVKISALSTITPLSTDLVVLDRPTTGTGAPITGKATLSDLKSIVGGAASGTFNEPKPAEFVTTASVSIAGSKGFSYAADQVGTDTFFFVSGNIGGKDVATPGVGVFGGDLIVSGAIWALSGVQGVNSYWASETAGEIFTSASLVNVPSGSVHAQFLSSSNGAEISGSVLVDLTQGPNQSFIISGSFGQTTLPFLEIVDSTLSYSLFTVGGVTTAGFGPGITVNNNDLNVYTIINPFNPDTGREDILVRSGSRAVKIFTNYNNLEYPAIRLSTTGAVPTGSLIVVDEISNPADLNLQIRALKINDDPGIAGYALTSSGPGVAPGWAPFPTSTAASEYWFSSGSNAIATTGSVALVGADYINLAYDTASDYGADIFLYVSGDIYGRTNSGQGVAVFGGDTVVSGVLFAENKLKVYDGPGGPILELDNGPGQASFYVSITGSSGMLLTGSSVFAGAGGISVGSDTVFFVSGATGNNSGKKAVFGGTAFVSGNLQVPFQTKIESRNLAGDGYLGIARYIDGGGTNLLLVGDSDGLNNGVAIKGEGVGSGQLAGVLALITGSSGGFFSGSYQFPQGISGSLTKLTDGSSYLVAGTNVEILTGTNGAVTISSFGGLIASATIVSSLPYTASITDYIIAVSASAGPGVALPSAALDGRSYIVKDVSGSAAADNIVVSVDGGGLIDGASSYTISINRGSATFVYFGNSIGWGVI